MTINGKRLVVCINSAPTGDRNLSPCQEYSTKSLINSLISAKNTHQQFVLLQSTMDFFFFLTTQINILGEYCSITVKNFGLISKRKKVCKDHWPTYVFPLHSQLGLPLWPLIILFSCMTLSLTLWDENVICHTEVSAKITLQSAN